MSRRILLSPPDVGPVERRLLLDAFDSNWIAPVGPHLDAFEGAFAEVVGAPDAVALSSGTAALHLGLLAAGVRPGDRVITSTLTFAATANAIVYVGAEPVFVDVSPDTWTIDPDLLAEELALSARLGRRVGAVIPVDLYGQCADYARIQAIADRYGVPVLADAAEALGASYKGEPAGSFGLCAAFSFNGNKIITTSGGGMLVSRDPAVMARVRYLSAQAREPVPYYEHHEVGYNYRMSNLLAALGMRAAQEPSDQARETPADQRAIPRRARGASRLVVHARGVLWAIELLADVRARRPDLLRGRPGARQAPPRFARYRGAAGLEAAAPAAGRFVDARSAAATLPPGCSSEGLCLPSGSSLSEVEQRRVISAIEELREIQEAREVACLGRAIAV